MEDGDLFCTNTICNLITIEDVIIKNNLLINNDICIANDVCTGNSVISNKLYCDSIISNYLKINGICHFEKVSCHHKIHGFLYINSLSIPLIYSLYDTNAVYSNLDIHLMMISGVFSC